MECEPQRSNCAGSYVLLRHPDPHDWVTSLSISGDGALLATGGLLDSVFIWDMKTTRLLHTFNPDNPGEYLEGIDQVDFHASLPYFAYIEGQGTICVARTDSWERVATLADTDVCAVTFAFDYCFPRIAFGIQNCCVEVRDIGNNQSVMSYWLPDTPVSLSFSSDSKILAAVCMDGSCHFLSTATGTVLHKLSAADEKYECGAFSPRRPLFLTASTLQGFSAWDETTAQLWRKRSVRLIDIQQWAVARLGPAFGVRSSDGIVSVWDFSENVVKYVNTHRPDKVTPICFSLDGQSLLIGGVDGRVQVIPLPG